MEFITRHKTNLLVILIYFLLTLIYFHQPLLHPGTVLYPAPDMVGEHTWWRHFLIDTIRQTHAIPLWYNNEFSGDIFQANPSTAIFYPINLLFFFITPEYGLTWDFFLDIFLMGVFTYFFVKKISKETSSAFISGTIAMLGGTAIARIYEGHVANFDVVIYLPLLLYFFEQQLQTGKIKYVFFNSITVALCILAGAPQLTVYVLFSSGLYVLLRLLFSYFNKEKIYLKKQLIYTGISFFIGFGLTAIQLFPSFEFAKYSVRNPKNYEFAASVSLKPFHTIAFIYPHFFGSLLNGGRIWGLFSFPEFSSYCGIASYLLALAAFFKKRNIYVWIFLILLLFSYLYSLGNYGPLLPLFYHLPVFGTFRIPASYLFLFAFSISVLAGFGLKNITVFVAKKNKIQLRRLRKIYSILGILSVIPILFFTIFSSIIIKLYYKILNTHFAAKDIHNPHIQDVYSWIIKDTITCTIFVVIFLLVYILFQTKRISKKIFIICIFLLIIVDLFYFDLPYLMARPYNQVYTQTVSKKLYDTIGDNRVYDIDIGVAHGSYKLDNINGYNPAYFSYYRDFLYRAGDHFTDPTLVQAPYVVLKKIDNLSPLRLLNTKYVLAQNKKDLDEFVPKNVSGTTIKKLDNYYAFEINNTQPKAYLVPNAEIITDFDKTLHRINEPIFDPNIIVILDQNPGVSLTNKLGKNQITTLKVLPNTISLTVTNSEPGFLVLSYVWYPGWNVYVNGKHVKLLKANGIFRGVYLKKGHNHVLFSFEPLSFKIGAIVSILFVLGLIISTISYTFYKHTKRR